MAFFSDRSSHYFSLSLHPTGDAKAYVFRLTTAQRAVAGVFLPLCFLTTLSLISVMAGGAIDRVGRIRAWLSESQEINISILAGIAFAVAVFELGWFLWVRSGVSILSEHERHSLRPLKLSRISSLMAYASFLFAMLVPLCGLFVIPRGFAGTGEDFSKIGPAGLIFLGSVGAGAVLLLFLLVRRLFHLFTHDVS